MQIALAPRSLALGACLAGSKAAAPLPRSLALGARLAGSKKVAAPRSRSLVISASFRRDDEKPSPLSPAFTRPREYAVGRVAMLGCAAAWAGEVLTGMGPTAQLSAELGVSRTTAYALIGALTAWQIIGGILRANSPGVYSARPATAEPAPFRNELLLGRAAMLIFAGATALEWLWEGESPLAHLGLIDPNAPGLLGAPIWLNLLIGAFALGGLGFFSANSKK